MTKFPCPICRQVIYVIGTDHKGKKIGSCGCAWKFKKTRFQKKMDREYVQTPTGLELKKKDPPPHRPTK